MTVFWGLLFLKKKNRANEETIKNLVVSGERIRKTKETDKLKKSNDLWIEIAEFR